MHTTPSPTPPLVAFVIGGVQKGGTTALASVLARHPSIAMPSRKEVHYFDVDKHFARGHSPIDAYHAFWGDRLGVATCGDATPAYCWWPSAAERIRDYNPAMRWVLLLRDSASRAHSQWNMLRERGQTDHTFEEALDIELAGMKEQPGVIKRSPYLVDNAFLSRGFYSLQLERIWGLFPREQVHVMRSDDLRGDPTSAVNRICAFLGVEPMGRLDAVEAHVGRYQEAMDPQTRANLIAFYDLEYRRLETMLGWDLSDWRR